MLLTKKKKKDMFWKSEVKVFQMRRKLRVSTTDSDTRQSPFKSLELAQRIKNQLRQCSNAKVQKGIKWLFKSLPCLESAADSVESAGKSGGEDWSGPRECKASIGPWEREQFASVQSKVPFPWHFLDNKSLINHWPWIRIFKGTNRSQDAGGACCACVNGVRSSYARWGVSAVDGLSKLINSLVSVDGSAHTCTHLRGADTWRQSQCWVWLLWYS